MKHLTLVTEEEYWKLLSKYRSRLISEPNEDIKNLIEELKIKLNITESIESIVDAWDDKDPWLLQFFYSIKEDDKTIEDFIGKCKLKSGNSNQGLPWEDIIASICIMPQNVRVTDIGCPHCRDKIVVLQFCSPISTWANMCGTGGLLAICPNCCKQLSYEFTICN